jgi:ABC-type cobalamin/Fe3+-siderophores transport system ATPase subunit
MLKASGVWFGYDARKPVVRGVSLAVPAAGIVGILGPNGSGKTTLLRMLAGTRHPQRGTVTLDEAPLTGFSRTALARRMAVVPQDTQLAFDYTVSEVAMMGRYPHLGAFEIEGPSDLAVIEETLASTGTLHLKDRLFATLSGGEKQRVIIAAALAQIFPDRGIFRLKAEATGIKGESTVPLAQGSREASFRLKAEATGSRGDAAEATGIRGESADPRAQVPREAPFRQKAEATGSREGAALSRESRSFRLQAEDRSGVDGGGYLLLDEPTASLDLGYQLEVASLLKQLHEEQRVAIVISTHDLGLAGTLCDSLLLIRDGTVVADGPTDEVLTAANIRAVFGVEAEVIRHASGQRIVVPLHRMDVRGPG